MELGLVINLSASQLSRESDAHPHTPEERAALFSAVDGSSAEVEVLGFLYALVRLFKPEHLLETGTGKGLTTCAIARAIRDNGAGRLLTVDIDPARTRDAEGALERCGCRPLVALETGDSIELLGAYSGPPFDFALFDSVIARRHKEFELLLANGKLVPKALCVFHDTSRLRGRYFHDFSPEMIASLDAHSQGHQWLECELSRGLRLIKLG